ncbi:hypothetical protein H8B13_18950 [Hymenobacter sp. BT188]|uniref:DUF6602 domain-containing protein n=1 Tax=Hymenobacter sp. BT188 TaxID=2763504 RepID=UPI0016516252|nr:DUF6602 domain-containing protein [Hymenobacter sp. BT188]MBC6608907.1 hypothetical protein [Hymenobacter sp. BT188]
MNKFQFDLNKFVSLEAKEIVNARERAISIHHTSDIDAAGDEVEKKIRDLIRNKLPLNYYVGHGHIADEELNLSGQHDLIIADNIGSPILFKSENNTEYFPYESVYSIGEIKSTYRSSGKAIEKYVSKIRSLQDVLRRKETPLNMLSNTVSLDQNFFKVPSNYGWPYRSYVYKFMLFANGGDFKIEQLKELYKNTENKYLPNVVVIFDQGIVINCELFDKEGNAIKTLTINPYPEFIEPNEAHRYEWLLVKFGESITSSSLAYLYFTLNDHLRKCLLLKPDLSRYFHNVGLFNPKLAFKV